MQLSIFKVIKSAVKEKTKSSVLFLRHMYKILRAALFAFDPEWVHYFSMNMLKFFCRLPFGKKMLSAAFRSKKNIVPANFFGITFPNRIGLGAGFDKNALYLNELEALGFGFVEIGTVTPLPQSGNDKPRLFRLPADKALINRMGFNNEGVAVIADRLKTWRSRPANHTLILGGNIGKNKMTANQDAWKDYVLCFNALHDFVDYFVVNVSSPNTPGLRELQEKDSLHTILTHLQNQNNTFKNKKPILLKIAPDLTPGQMNDIIDLAIAIKLDGLVAANTSISREHLKTGATLLKSIGAGGLSGMPLKQKSTEMIEYIHQRTNGKIPVIASGGVFTASDAKEKIMAGASLVQVWTGFVYEGPGIVKNICKGL